jgi:AcrR family transcriptional regulator
MLTPFTLRLESNSVNMNSKPVRKTYHHGDLRAALIEAGLKLLGERNADDLGLREVAREVGVSATSVYRHFPDKDALLTALAGEGLTQLAVAQHEAAAAAGGGAAGFSATGAAYVRFALANPALFRLMFANPSVTEMLTEPPAGTPDAMAFLKANAAAQADRKGGDAQVILVHAWAIAHGLAMLMLDGQVTADDALIDRVIDGSSTG